MNDTNRLLLLRPDLLIKHNKSGGFLTIALIYYIFLAIENSLLLIILLTSIDKPSTIDHPVWFVLWIIVYLVSCALSCNISHAIVSRPFDGIAKLRVLSLVYTLIDLFYVISQHYTSNGDIPVTYITPVINIVFCVYFWSSEKVKYRQICGNGYCNLIKKDFGKCSVYSSDYNNMIYYFSLELYTAKSYWDYCGKDPINISLFIDLYNCFYFVLKRTIKLDKDNSIKSIRNIVSHLNPEILPHYISRQSYNSLLNVYNKTKHDDDLYIPALVNQVAENHRSNPKVKINSKEFVTLLSIYEYNLIIGDFCRNYYSVLYTMCINNHYDIFGIDTIFNIHSASFTNINKPKFDDFDYEELQEIMNEYKEEIEYQEHHSSYNVDANTKKHKASPPTEQLTLFDIPSEELSADNHKIASARHSSSELHSNSASVQTARQKTQLIPNRLFCTKCGVHLPADAVFCHKCGSKVYKE